MLRHNRALVVLLVMATLTYLLLLTNGVTSQSQDRMLETKGYAEAPAKVSFARNPHGRVDLGKSFTAEDDWFKGLSITIQNSSKIKNITHLTVGLLFPKKVGRDSQEDSPFYYSIAYGRDPRLEPLPGATNQIQPIILPGATAILTLSDDNYNSILSSLGKLKYPRSIKTIKIIVEKIFFDDGTSWYAGRFFRQAPNDSQKYLPIEQPLTGCSGLASGLQRIEAHGRVRQ